MTSLLRFTIILLFFGCGESLIKKTSGRDENCTVINAPSGCLCDCSEAPLCSLKCTGLRSSKVFRQVLKNFSENENKFTLANIQITESYLKVIPWQSFKDFTELKTLNLSNNNLSAIVTNGIIMEKLENFDFSQNHLTELSEKSVAAYPNLGILSFARNNIRNINSQTFHKLVLLRKLNLSYNHLKQVDENWFVNLSSLVILSLSNNQIQTLDLKSFQDLSSLESLNLANNELLELFPEHFLPLKSLKKLYLDNNNLTTLSSGVLNNTHLEYIDLTGNLWNCSSGVYWLIARMKDIEKMSTKKIVEPMCYSPPETRDRTIPKGIEVIKVWKKINESLLCKSCSCTEMREVAIVNCSGKNFEKLPESLPYKTRTVDLSNNKIKWLSFDHTNSADWGTVAFLHLDNNNIESLKEMEGTQVLKQVVLLSLTGNKLTEIPIHLLDQAKMLEDLNLSKNPWKCDCNTVRFQRWLQNNYKQVQDIKEVRCSADSGPNSNQPIFKLIKSDLCPQPVQLINYLDILNAVMALLIVIIVSKLIFDYCRQKRTGKLPTFFSFKLQ